MNVNLSKAKVFLETSRVACKWLKDTHSLTREQGTRVENNRKSIQESKGNIKNNVREIFCIKANLGDKVSRIEHLEKQIRSQETALVSQERKLEDLEEVIRKRGDRIQAQNSRVDILSQPTYQEIPVQFVTVTSQNPNQLLEPQTEQEFTELLHSYSNSSSRIKANPNISEEDLPPPPATPQTTLLDLTITPPRTPLTPTLGLTPRVRDNTQLGTKDLARENRLVESLESPTDPATTLSQ